MFIGLLALLVPILHASAISPHSDVKREPVSRFVSIDKKTFDFVANGIKIDFVGTNAYWLPTLNSEADIDSVLASMSAAGVKVVRTWAFNDVDAIPENGTWFQLIANGTTSINTGPNGLQKLDTVIRLAEKHGVFVLLSLTNNWNPRTPLAESPDGVLAQGRDTSHGTSTGNTARPRNALSNDYGGMDAYVREFGKSSDHDEFYTSPIIMSNFLNYTSFIASRYRNNTSIFSWEIANDPRCASSLPASPSCNTTTVTTFHVTVSKRIKAVDPNHLISSGNQGFICNSCPKIIPVPPRKGSLTVPRLRTPSASPRPSSSPSALPVRARSVIKARRLIKLLTAERKSTLVNSRKHDIETGRASGLMRIRGGWVAPPTLSKRQSADPSQGTGPAFDGSQGVDSQDILNIPDISFSTFQLFPDQNSYGMDDPTLPTFNNTINQGLAWIRQHAAIGMMASKPVTLNGFGLVSQSNVPFFVPFNTTDAVFGNSTAGLNATPFITEEQRDEAYTLWLRAGLEAGLQGMFQYQWSQANLTAVLGTSISSNTDNTGNIHGKGVSPNDGYGQTVGDLGVQTVIKQVAQEASMNT